MRRVILGVLLVVVLSALAGVAGAWFSARYLFNDQAGSSASLHAFVHKELKLSPAQAQQMEVLEQDFAQRRRAREAELRAANGELAAAIQARHEDSPEVQAAIEHFHHAMGELQKDTIHHTLAMRTVLTPAQAVMFDRRIGQALTEQVP